MSAAESQGIDGAGQLRALDRDRFLTALFAPPAVRADLLALYAFNLEVARIPELVSEPMIGEIRLAWWREAIGEIYEGRTRRHEVVEALAAAIPRHNLPRDLFDRLIDARAHDLDDAPPATLAALITYAEGSSSTLMELALRLLAGELAGEAQAAARQAGVAYALAGILRAIPFHAQQGRVLLPADLLAQHSVDPHDILHGRPTPGLTEIVRVIHGRAVQALADARKLRRHVPRAGVPALLPGALASGYLGALARAGFDPFAANYDRGAAWRASVLMARGLVGRY